MTSKMRSLLLKMHDSMLSTTCYGADLLTARSLRIRGLIEFLPDQVPDRTFILTLKGEQLARKLKETT